MDDFIRPKRPKLDLSENTTADSDTIPEPAFMPPEEVADQEITAAANESVTEGAVAPHLLEPKNKRRFSLHMPRGKKQWIITSIILVLLLGGGGAAAWWFLLRETPKPVTKAPVIIKKEEEPPKPTTEASKLSGLEVPIGTNLEPVTAIMIENSPSARPQAGLKEAGIVFEAVAEGGITRFVALFQDTAPDYVGPVRSVRPYYLDWIWPFDAAIAHVGGAPQALSDIKTLKIKDLDQFANGGSYHRISSRYAPHNVYTSLAKLNDLEKKKGFTTANFTGFDRKKEAKATTPTAKTINLDMRGFTYNVSYTYNPATNAYLRSEGGAAHKDDKSGTQLEPKVVVAVVMPRGIASDGQHTEYTTVGSGKVYVFQDGIMQEGTWNKSGRQAQWQFTDAAGKTIAFNPGQTWFTIVDTPGSVTQAP
jgi:hypothetical protein